MNLFEDFEPGRTFSHHWGRTVMSAEAVAFATGFMVREPATFNAAYAAHNGHRDVHVHGLHVFAVVLGLSVEDLSESGGPFLGAESVRYHEAVYPGDTLFACSTVVCRRESRSRAGYGVVEWETTGVNQHAVPVVSFKRTSLVRRRDAGPAAPDETARGNS